MAKKIKGPSRTDAQERKVRKDKRLNPTGKVLWLLTSLSGNAKETAFMTEDKMASQLTMTKRQLRDSLAIIEQQAPDLFQKEKVKGFHRANRWRRQLLPKEEAYEFVRRVQTHPIMDLCTGMHWVAIDGAKDTGVVEFAARQFWDATREAFRIARNKMNALGYITVVSDPKSGKPATYTLNEARFATVEIEHHERTEQRPPQQPTPAWVAKQKKIEEQRIERERLAGEQEERRRMLAEQHQKILAAEMGASLEGVTARRITAATPKPVKRIIPIWGTSKAQVMIDENDL